DPAVADLDQVLGGHQAAGPVGRPDRRDAGVGLTDRVHDDHWQSHLRELRPVNGRQFGQHEDHPVDLARQQPSQPLLGTGFTGHDRYGDATALGAGRLFSTADNLNRPRAQVGESQVNQARPAYGPARGVLVIREQRFDPQTRPGGDVGAAVADLRDRRDRDPGRFRDVG